jgi:hypothetical protein
MMWKLAANWGVVAGSIVMLTAWIIAALSAIGRSGERPHSGGRATWSLTAIDADEDQIPLPATRSTRPAPRSAVHW